MYNNKLFNILLCLFFLGIYSTTIFAQNDAKIILLDADNSLPIEGATFEYGTQNGISDEQGVLTFTFQQNKVMVVSHLKYGSWIWSAEALPKIIEQQTYYRKNKVTNLYPVTVISMRPNRKVEENINIDHQDRMQHDGAAILNQLPAISSIRKGGNYGFDPVFRGFKYDQLNIVLNGAQSATAACPNRMDPPTSQMAPNMMDRIELLKGPHALRYGTGFGGTINFVPTKLRFTDQRNTYGRISSEYQSNGNVLRGEGQIGLSGKRYDLSLLGSWSQGDDYTAGNGQTIPADFQRGSLGANLGLKLSSNQQIRLSALYNLARDADFPALPMDLREDDTWMFNARHDITFDNRPLQSWNTTLFGSFVNHLMDNLLKPLDPRMLNASTEATTYNYGGRTEGMWLFNKGKMFAGADLRVEGAEGIRERMFLMGPNAGNTFMDNAWQDSRISKTGLFAEFHLDTDILRYTFSGRLEVNTATINDPSEEFKEVNTETQTTQVNPSISFGAIKKLGKNTQLGLWLGRAQRSGSLTERFINYFPVGLDPYEMLGNPQLDPEINNQVDLTFEWKQEKTVLNVDLFSAFLQDYISSFIDPNLSPRLPMSPGVRQFENIDRAFKTGFEVNWTQQLFAGLQQQLGLAYTYAQDLERDAPLPEIAPLDFRYTLSGSYLQDKLQPALSFRQTLEQDRISTEFGETRTPAFTLLDVKVAYQVNDQIRLNVGVNNLFDENYYEHLNRSVRGTTNAIYEPGRNFFTSLSVNFE